MDMPTHHDAVPEGAIDFTTAPDDYRHWKLSIEGGVAWLMLDVDEDHIIGDGYALKLVVAVAIGEG